MTNALGSGKSEFEEALTSHYPVFRQRARFSTMRLGSCPILKVGSYWMLMEHDEAVNSRKRLMCLQ